MASHNPSATDGASGNEVAVALVSVVQRMIEEAVRPQVQEALRLQEQETDRRIQEEVRLKVEEAVRLQEQEAQRRLQEALRLQEERAATALRQRDNAISALRHSLDERVQRLEARVAAVEEQLRSSSARESEGALGRLESRMGKWEGAVQRALVGVFPRVEALVERLETSPPGAPLSPSTSSVSTSSAPQPPAASVAPGASVTEVAAADDVHRQRQQLERRVKEVERRMLRSRAAPCHLGEALCNATDPDEVRRLLDSGADVHYTSTDGCCPLISVIMTECDIGNDYSEVVSLLLARGADANSIDVEGSSALHLALGGNNVDLLIAAGADLDARDENGATPLHWAAELNDVGAVRSLVAAGANKCLRPWSGPNKDMTPFDLAPSDKVRGLLRP